MKKSVSLFLAAAAFAFAPNLASAVNTCSNTLVGEYVGTCTGAGAPHTCCTGMGTGTCTGTVGLCFVNCNAVVPLEVPASIKPAFNTSAMGQSTGALTQIGIKGSFDGCLANAATVSAFATLDAKKLGGVAGLTAITNADLKIKGIGWFSCDFVAPPALAYPISAKVKVGWLNGTTKVAKSQIFGSTLNADIGTFSAVVTGVVTKGMGLGAVAEASAGLDASPADADQLANFNDVVGCNLGTPIVQAEVDSLPLEIGPGSFLRVYFAP